MSTPIRKTLQLYICKRLKQLLRYQVDKLKVFIQDKLRCGWTLECNFREKAKIEESRVDVLPIIQEGNQSERFMRSMIVKIAVNNDPNAKQLLKRTIEDSKTCKNLVAIGLAFLNSVYLTHSNQANLVSRHLKVYFDQELEKII